MSNSLCGGASFGGSRSLSKIFDRASQSAFVTGEWYIPGHKLMGFRVEELPSMAEGGGPSKGEAKVENTEMVPLGGEEFKPMGILGTSWNWVSRKIE